MTEETTDPRLVDAQIKKALAEALKFEREALDLEASTQIKLAEARQKVAHAEAAEHGAVSMRVQKDQALRSEQVTLAANHYHHVYIFNQPVYADHPQYGDPVGDCLAQLAVWDRMDPTCDMTVEFNSPGGDVVAGMHLFDQISAYSKRPWDNSGLPKGTHKTTGIIRGEAASMAGILVQAFDERVQGPQATLMIHQVSSWAGGSLGDLKDHMDWLDDLTARVADIFVKRSAGATSPEAFEELWSRKAKYLNAQQSLEHRFVDRIG